MKSILALTDFSDTASKAVAYAEKIARKGKLRLVILHVCDMLDYSFPDRKLLVREYNKMKKREYLKKLHEMEERIQSSGKMNVSIELYDGDFMESIYKVIEQYKISIIVMGMVGKGCLLSKFIGGKASLVFRKSSIPVLGIPYSYNGSLPVKVAVAIEEYERITEDLNTVLDLVSLFSETIAVLHFSANKVPVYELMDETRTVHHFTSRLQKKYSNLSIDEIVIGSKNFRKSFMAYIDNSKTNLLVMFAHHREWTDQITGLSTTQKIIRSTHIPVLILPSSSLNYN